MHARARTRISMAVVLTIGCALRGTRSRADDPPFPTESGEAAQRPQRGLREPTGAYKLQIRPHWFHDGTRFWYRNELKGNTTEYILVDAESGTRQPAFDHQRLATALSRAA